ncbi:hypothetical protein KSP39_PZI009168 [Platanthera zijinensis]|uniref:Uncharacterized protein n=1 Tax=Platanthera zijinensis TaxID=2320716 RepID=A0AAP0BKP8_9ASPA
MEHEESSIAWNAKQDSFMNCVKISEEDMEKKDDEISRLAEAHNTAKEENSKLRDIIKQAVNEAMIGPYTTAYRSGIPQTPTDLAATDLVFLIPPPPPTSGAYTINISHFASSPTDLLISQPCKTSPLQTKIALGFSPLLCGRTPPEASSTNEARAQVGSVQAKPA